LTKQLFNPQLRAARFLPRTIISARTLPTLRILTKLTKSARRPDAQVVSVDADVSVHVFRPASARPRTPALLWIHGGGMVLGDAAQDSGFCRRIAGQLNIVVISVEYRLAPEYPFPTPLEDCYTALQRLARQPDIDPARIAVGGASAGGGLAAALALLAKERGEIRPVLQLLSYPMLDDGTTTRTDIDPRRLRIWSRAATGSAGVPRASPHSLEAMTPIAPVKRPPPWCGGPPRRPSRRTLAAANRAGWIGHVDQALPEAVRTAVVQVCRDAFYYRDDVRSLFVGAGVPPGLYDRYDSLENSKAKIARFVLNDLQSLGANGQTVQRKIVEELCHMDRPHPDAPDQERGRAALVELKRAATSLRILVDPDEADRKRRRAQADQQQRARQQRQERLGALRTQFFDLLIAQPRTQAERQRRGYDLEQLLADLFEAYDLSYRRPYRAPHEQVDGSFHFRGFTYTVEAKWEALPPTFGDLVKFKANVDGKLDSTRGLFVSMASFDDNQLEHFLQMPRGGRNNVILVDAQDLIAIFEGRITLPDALIAKIDAAEQEGRPWYPVRR
jgi:acetyl esterase/lipase